MEPEQMEAILNIARKVYGNEKTQAEGANFLVDTYGGNRNSAIIMIATYKKMMRGNKFGRAPSAVLMDYYLEQIMSKNSTESLVNSLNALWQHILYYKNKTGNNLKSFRKLHHKYSIILERRVVDFDDLNEEFENSVRAETLRISEGREPLDVPENMPQYRLVKVYERDPRVTARVLLNANGTCGGCGNQGPFMRAGTETLYLEVHHIIRLADGGADTVENAIALCPNCHRKLHFGQPDEI